MQPHQALSEHQSHMPVVIEVVRGRIRVALDGSEYELGEGDLFEVPEEQNHHIVAIEASLLRLSLYRVSGILNDEEK